MSYLKLPRKPFHLLRPSLVLRPHFSPPRRFQSSSSSRIDRVLNRLPKFLHPYTSALRTAPVSHIASFLILHEITAILPLVGLAGAFHYTEWLPQAFVEGRWVTEGVEKFGRYFGRKGWFGVERLEGEREEGDGRKEEGQKKWVAGESGKRILVEVATAYAITKVLLPVRIIFSIWATPWFARTILRPVRRLLGKKEIDGVAAARKEVNKKTP